jgi:hypothetical protein
MERLSGGNLLGIGFAMAVAVAVVAPAFAKGEGQAPLAALAQLEPGLWQVRDLDGRGEQRNLCISDPQLLMQLQHRGSPCSRLVISNDDRGATVHYTCPADGFGRTSLRVETPRLARIESQGIQDKAPFAFRAEARRVGACGDGGGTRSAR